MVNPSQSPISWRHLGALLVGALCIAFAPIFVVLAKRTGGVGMIDAAFWRVAIGGLALVPLMAMRGHPPGAGTETGGAWRWLPGLLFAADVGVWHLSFDHTSVANSTLLANGAVVLVTLFAWWFWKERITGKFVAGAIISAAGVVLLVLSSSRRGEVVPGGNPVLGDALGVATAVFYAGYLLTTKRYRRQHPASRLMVWSSLSAALILFPLAWFHPTPFWPDSATGWWMLAGIGLVSHAGGQGLIAYGLGGLPASLAAIGLLFQPVCTAVLGSVILGQKFVPWQIGGGTLVLAGLALAIFGQVGKIR